MNKRNAIHGSYGTITHASWRAMRRRCFDKNMRTYPRYGGRGVKVCERWFGLADGFQNFLADMGHRPSLAHSIDRIDVDGHYCPENCRWATVTEQAANRSNNRRVTIDGETLCSQEWAKRYGIKLTTIHGRMSRGETFEQALKRPAAPWRKLTMVTIGRKTMCLSQWCDQMGIDDGTVRSRIATGWSVREAIMTPAIFRGQPGRDRAR